MREIKFRAKVADSDYENEKQIEMIGSFVHFTGFIGLENDIGYVEQLEEIHGVGWFNVDLKTLGQYTGLKDKHGTEIFEGDMLGINNTRYVVGYRAYSGGWQLEIKNEYCAEMVQGNCDLLEVIGNIYENPELLDA